MVRFLVVEADGGSRGNPGPAGFGAIVRDGKTGEVLREIAEAIGVASNNVAEYRGLIAGLSAAHEVDPSANITVRMDSKLVVEQMSGGWRIKHPDMHELARKARDIHDPALTTYQWIPREQNAYADALANKALDGVALGSFAPKKQINFLTERITGSEKATTIYFVRHGTTDFTTNRRFSGGDGNDPALNALGLQQAQNVAREMAKIKPEILISSPLTRTMQTAAEISNSTGLSIIEDDSWIEIAFGKWDGLTFDDVKREYPKEAQEWLSSTASAPPGGESYDQLGERIDLAIDALVAAYPERKICVVTHNVVIRQIVRLTLSSPSHAAFHVDIDPCSITTLSVWHRDGLRILRSFSEVGHNRGSQ
jgi:probable phosphoglycerate mutase